VRLAVLGYAGSLHTERWAAFLAECGHEVHVVTCGGSADVTALPPDRIHDVGAPRSKLGYVAKIPSARRILRRLRPDALHVHSATSYGLLALASGVQPLVVTAHGSDLLRTPRNPFIRPVVRRALRRAALVTVPSEQMRRTALSLAAPATPRIEVFQYGVDAARLGALGSERTRETTIRAVSARPLEPLYHVDAVVHAIAELRRRGTAATLDVYGGGSERGSLERLVRDGGLDDAVVLHGPRPPDEVERAFAGADVALSVSESDGVSIALLEAMAAGAIPVVSDIEANREWIEDGENGVLVSIDPADIARGVERALQLDPDAVARRNQELVAARADRATNLRRFEAALTEFARRS
jgi:glycosyltransferase involved in cell wall biosynthesis